MQRIILVTLVLLVFSSSSSASNLNQTQINTLQLAYHIGNQIEYRGSTFGETVASIVFQESKAGLDIYRKNGVIVGDKDRRGRFKSLGVMQVQVPAARDVLRWYPEAFYHYYGGYRPTDEELIIHLLTDDEFNILMGAHYFLKMLEITGNWRAAILAYNRGANHDGRDPNDYVAKTLNWRTKIIIPLMK